MRSVAKEFEMRLKEFIDNKIHTIIVVRAGDSYSWGYRDAMEEVLVYLDDMVSVTAMLEKPTIPIC